LIRALWRRKRRFGGSKGVSSIIGAVILVVVMLMVSSNVFLWALSQNTLYSEKVNESNQLDADIADEKMAVAYGEYSVIDDAVYVDIMLVNEGPVAARIVTLWVVDNTLDEHGFTNDFALGSVTNFNPGEYGRIQGTVQVIGVKPSHVLDIWFVTARGNFVDYQDIYLKQADLIDIMGPVTLRFESLTWFSNPGTQDQMIENKRSYNLGWQDLFGNPNKMEDRARSIYATYTVDGGEYTFGLYQIGSKKCDVDSNTQVGSSFTLLENASVTKITVYLNELKIGKKHKCAVYADSDGVPGGLIAETAEWTCDNEAAHWQDFPISPAASLSAGTYWLVHWSDHKYEYRYDETDLKGTGLYGTWQIGHKNKSLEWSVNVRNLGNEVINLYKESVFVLMSCKKKEAVAWFARERYILPVGKEVTLTFQWKEPGERKWVDKDLKKLLFVEGDPPIWDKVAMCVAYIVLVGEYASAGHFAQSVMHQGVLVIDYE